MSNDNGLSEPQRILIVDDHPLFRDALHGAVRVAYPEVETVEAKSIGEALEVLGESGSFDLCLLDLNMPRLDGLETLRTLKRDPALRHIPVIVLTVSDQPSDIRTAYAEGAAGYVRKPDDFEAFAAVARELQDYWTLVCRLPA